MLWLASGQMRAICGEVEINVLPRNGGFFGPVTGSKPGGHYGYEGAVWQDEPTADEFVGYVLAMLENLRRDGRL